MEIFLIVLLLIICIVSVSIAVINNSFRKPIYRLSYKNFPKEQDGFRIVFLTDFHDRFFSPDNQKPIEAVKSLKPDIIAFGGDMHTSENHDIWLSFVEKLSEIAPIYAVDGNHEANIEPGEEYKHKLSKYVKYLDGDSVSFGKINISGVNWKHFPKKKPQICDGMFNICLMHDPLSFDEVKKLPDLMLSGHVHGGCLRLPFIGAVFSPGYGASVHDRFSRRYLFPKYSLGIYEKGDKKLVVSSGIGNTFIPFRLLRPEITVIELNNSKN